VAGGAGRHGDGSHGAKPWGERYAFDPAAAAFRVPKAPHKARAFCGHAHL